MQKFILINPNDNVAVALQDLKCGDVLLIEAKNVVLKCDIPAGHKIALKDFAEGEQIVKYGTAIGSARQPLAAGEWVNEKNLRTNLSGLQEYQYQPVETPVLPRDEELTFLGYKRKNGLVGIRNEVWIIPTVGCVSGVAQKLAAQLQAETQSVGVDAIVAFTHNYGCSQLGADHENTRKILRNMVLHPNAGAVLVVGLGCENNQVSAFRDLLGDYDTERIRFIETQKVEDEIESSMQILRELYQIASHDVRSSVPLSHLRVGLKCGGSDGFSGITANPLVGRFSDLLVSQGGTTVLTEVPEMFGAETLLMNRCASSDIFARTVEMINDFKTYFIENKQHIYENPSPGNKAGGISTLEEKSLGCTQKSGSSPVRDVLHYGDQLRTNGLNLLSASGNDLVASTALAAAGCQLVLFTTGRGTPFGTFVPTVKVSTNSLLAQRKMNWIDFDAGTLVEDGRWNDTLCAFARKIIAFASGEHTKNEKNGYRDFAIFKTGVTL